jgi:autotransporter passenger strand-loop-strand repeat protein
MAFTASVSGTVSSELISSGVQNVYSGGIAVSCAIINGGWQYLYDDGVASYTKVDSAGRQIVSSGGTAFYTLINNNGAQLVEGAASGVIITSGGYQGVGGMTDTVIISSGGMQFIQSHGIANSTLISSGGSQFINSAGSATNTNISGGNQIIGSGGIAALTTLSGSGQQNIYAGGTADSTLISSGGAQHVSGIANSTIVYSGGLQLVESGGTANSTIISSGGNQSIISGGTASSSMIDFCGNQMVESGGTANFTAISSGGAQNIQSKGVANATIISAGGTQTVSAGGVANNTYNYGMQKILSGGVASNVVVNSGGGMYVSAGGGFGGALTINGGGHVTVDHPGNFEPVAVNIKLANARANDAIMIIQANVDNVNGTLLAVDVSNTLSGLYILTYGTNLTGMNGAMFAVKDGVQTVNVKVGSSYTFADGDKLSLGFTDGITDKLTATFTVKGEVLDLTAPTVPTGLKAALTGDTLGLTWNDSTDAGGIKQYELWGDEYSDFSSPLENGYHKFVSETKDAIPNMEAGVYYMKVRAQDNGGNWSNWSTSVSTTVFGTLAINSTVKGYVGSTDFYKLTLGNAGTLNLSLTGLTANADLVLLTATGTVLKTSANTGNSNEAINGVALLAGNYYVKVGPSGKIDTDYTLGNTFNALPADTAANDYMTAKNIDAGVDNWVGFGDAADFYKLTMINAGMLNVGLTGLTGNADLSLLSSTGAVLKSNIKTGIASEGISDAALLAGTYYVKVAAATGVNDAGYTLINQINYFPGDTYDKAGNTSAMAKLVDGPAQTGWVGMGDSDDLYKFVFDASVQGTIRLYDLKSGNADLSLYNDKGTLLKKSSKLGILEDTITSTLAAGTYYAKVNAVSGNSIDYKLDFTKNNVAGMLAG